MQKNHWFPIKNVLLSYRKTLGCYFRARKKPLREWPRALPSFRAVLFWLPKSPCGHGDTHSLGCPAGWDPFTYDFTLKIKYLGKWSNLPLQSSGEIPIISPPIFAPDAAIPALAEGVAQHAPPQQQEPHLGVRARCLRGAPSVCQTTGQSGDGGPFGQGIPRSEPSF